jgi:hypothetical protein
VPKCWGGGIIVGATIAAFATQTWGAASAGSKIVFSTTANGSTTLNTVLTLGQDQSATFAGPLFTTSGTPTFTSVNGNATVTLATGRGNTAGDNVAGYIEVAVGAGTAIVANTVLFRFNFSSTRASSPKAVIISIQGIGLATVSDPSVYNFVAQGITTGGFDVATATNIANSLNYMISYFVIG